MKRSALFTISDDSLKQKAAIFVFVTFLFRSFPILLSLLFRFSYLPLVHREKQGRV